MGTNPIDLRLRELSTQAKKTDAERMVDSLRDQHRRIMIDLGGDDDKAPAWYAHLPSGQVMPIHYIGTWGPFVRLTGFGACTDECDYALLAPEQVVVSIRSLPDDSEPRRPIGFGDWPHEEDEDAGEAA
jgi:hypothetical protein